ncbi:hypothetical protein SPAN111604_07865 [Sphingomonas antarctica]
MTIVMTGGTRGLGRVAASRITILLMELKPNSFHTGRGSGEKMSTETE